MSEFQNLTLSNALNLLKKGEITAVNLTEYYLNKIHNSKKLNAFCLTTSDLAISQAKNCDKMKSDKRGKLCGIPIAVKDIFCTKNQTTQAASKILEGFIPDYESTITAKLWNENAIMLGKLNMDEFAMGSSNETSIYGPAINPWKSKNNDEHLTPGGSSGGSAAAVAADLCVVSIGTDTGGSIRQPASFNGVVGLKPTYGRCSRWGIIAFASSLDQAGPITKTVRDSAILLNIISGHDSKDSTSSKNSVPDFEALLNDDLRGKKIGIPKEYQIDDTPTEISKLWENGVSLLKDAGAEVINISLPHTKYSLPAYYVIAPAEASSNLARYDGVRYGYRALLKSDGGINELYKMTRSEGFGDEVKRRIMIGTYVLSAGFYEAYYQKALKVRSLIEEDFNKVFSSGIDVILTPTTPSPAFALNSKIKESPVEMYLNDIFTVPVNLAGLPAISIPTGLSNNNLPLGLQLIGPKWNEQEILNVAYRLEKDINFNYKPKSWWNDK
ncbi:MAG: Asp-tRNA(Asn)/Glu-tRNA(Gln) amidotransferase subunit GatA [Paracoccaceae bacterium]